MGKNKITDIADTDVGKFAADELNKSRDFHGTLTVHMNDDLLSVMELAEKGDKSLIVVLDNESKITGVVAPKQLVANFNENASGQFVKLKEVVRGLPLFLKTSKEDIHNFTRVHLVWCARHNHLTSEECKEP